MSSRVDFAIIGAGPAGLAAASTARKSGLKAAVFDEQPEPGGQIYRSIETLSTVRRAHLDACGPDYAAGLALVRELRNCAVYRPLTTVWQIDRHRVYVNDPGGAAYLDADCILIATGAMERPVPIPGATLPGVLGCGGAQILFKSAGVVPDGRIFVAGSGPLPLLFTWQMLRLGVKIAALLETTPLKNYVSAIRHLPAALAAPGYLSQGMAMLRDIRRAGIPIARYVSGLRAHGDDRLREIEYRVRGRRYREPADVLLLHEGVVPNANLMLSMGCKWQWDEAQRCFRPVLDAWGETSVERVFVAGDSGGIGGARAAEYTGRLAALAAAHKLGRISADERDAQAAPLRSELSRHLQLRPFLDLLSRPRQETIAPHDPRAIVCRCEEVTAGEIRALVKQGCPGPNQMKAFSRCGMGPCQGRNCGLSVAEIIAEARGMSVPEVGYYRIRSPVKPITVGDFVALRPYDLP